MYNPFKILPLSLFLFGFATVIAQETNSSTTPQGASPDSPHEMSEHSIITDRPDATESPNTVEPGFVQIETGGLYAI